MTDETTVQMRHFTALKQFYVYALCRSSKPFQGSPTTARNGKKERQAFHYSLPLLESTRRGLSSLSQYKNTPQAEEQANGEVA